MTSPLLSAITEEMGRHGWRPAPLNMGGRECPDGCEAASFSPGHDGHTITLVLDPIFRLIATALPVADIVRCAIDIDMGEPETGSIN